MKSHGPVLNVPTFPVGSSTTRQAFSAGAPPGRRQANQNQARRYDSYDKVGSGGRGQFDAAFPNLGSMLAPMEATNLLPPAQGWTVLESTSWLTSTPYHGLRKLRQASRDSDTLAVYDFLRKEGIIEVNWHGNNVIRQGRSDSNLFRRNIQKEFYWIWKSQVRKLSEFISRESRSPTMNGLGKNEAKKEINDCLHS